MLKKHVFGSFNLNNFKIFRFSFGDILLGTLDTYTIKNEHTLDSSGGGGHSKVCWLIAPLFKHMQYSFVHTFDCVQWFKSYLENRKQFVQIHTSKSDTETVTCGVPQGSILDPLLFILYINDLSNVTDALFPILIADDTSVYIEPENESTVISILNEELNKMNI